MSERVVRFLLGEVKTLRITCKNCQAVVESPMHKLSDVFIRDNNGCYHCRFCNEDIVFPAQTQRSPFAAFADAANAIEKLDGKVEIQFVFPGE